jgi:hypothetical protein
VVGYEGRRCGPPGERLHRISATGRSDEIQDERRHPHAQRRRDLHGVCRATEKLPGEYFEQFALSTFLGSDVPPTASVIVVNVTAGSLFMYASTTDNKTNDSAIKFLTIPTNQ